MKRIPVILLLACLLLPITAYADWTCPNCGQTGLTGNFCSNCATARPADASVIARGTRGTNVNWTLTADGTLTISGSGAMADITIAGDRDWNGYMYEEKVTKVVISAGVTSIGNSAFSGCKNLREITIPAGVKSIGDSAFTNCTSLAEVNLPNGLESIGQSAFEGCTALQKVNIPRGVTVICTSTFKGCEKLTTISLPTGVTTIGSYAFQLCTGLRSIYIPDTVTTIGTSAFFRCTSLTKIVLPDGLKDIDSDLFYYCTNLESVSMPSTIDTIYTAAFMGCTSLKEISIPAEYRSGGRVRIQQDAFSGCTSLKKIVFRCSRVPSLDVDSFKGVTATAYYFSTWDGLPTGKYGGNLTWKLNGSAGSSSVSSGGGTSYTVKAGDYITFGHYEQDNYSANGKEPIEWLVLDVTGSQALVVSRYGLDAKLYNAEFTSVTWETCSLRKWLNNDFLNAAFTGEEQKAILLTAVDNSSGQGFSGFSGSGGRNTQDRIFLLSYAEANQYFGVESFDIDGAARNLRSRIAPTAYAKAHGAYTDNDHKTSTGAAAGWWWLRSPANDQYIAARVNSAGALEIDLDDGSGCVRPAMVIDLNSGLF